MLKLTLQVWESLPLLIQYFITFGIITSKSTWLWHGTNVIPQITKLIWDNSLCRNTCYRREVGWLAEEDLRWKAEAYCLSHSQASASHPTLTPVKYTQVLYQQRKVTFVLTVLLGSEICLLPLCSTLSGILKGGLSLILPAFLCPFMT